MIIDKKPAAKAWVQCLGLQLIMKKMTMYEDEYYGEVEKLLLLLMGWKKERLEEPCSSNWTKKWIKKQRITTTLWCGKTNIISILRVEEGIYIIIIIIIMLVLAPAWSSESRLWTSNPMRQKIKKIHRAAPIYFST